MLVDANLLIYAFDDSSPFHATATTWLTRQLNGSTRVGFPWQSLTAFVRVVTHPRAAASPITPDAAWQQVEEWVAADLGWVPVPTDRHGEVLGGLIRRYQLRGNLISDASMAALAIEHGLTLCSADTDFARFEELTWENPLASGS
jgi:toxin-antitoxin system PIN domain toxin